MPTINMIANRRAEKRRQEQNIRKLIYGISAEVGLIIAISVLSVRQLNVRGHEVDLTAQLQNLQPKVNKIQALQAEITELQPKVKTLNGAKTDTLFWYSNLYNIAASLPDKTWFTSLGIGATGPGLPGAAAGSDPTINIAGMTLNQSLVGEAMLRMNQSPGMDHVVLSYVQQQKTGSTDTVAFQMTAHLKPEPGAAPKGGTTNVSKA